MPPLLPCVIANGPACELPVVGLAGIVHDGTQQGSVEVTTLVEGLGLAEPGTIYLDADACPVKDYVFRVAARYEVPLFVVANTPIRIPEQPGLNARLKVVPDSPDAADDWIAENAVKGDLVLTADIPLAARVIGNDVEALDFRGSAYNPNRIGDALASRDLNAHLRSVGLITGGPSAFGQKEKSKFASTLDAAVGRMKRRASRPGS